MSVRRATPNLQVHTRALSRIHVDLALQRLDDRFVTETEGAAGSGVSTCAAAVSASTVTNRPKPIRTRNTNGLRMAT